MNGPDAKGDAIMNGRKRGVSSGVLAPAMLFLLTASAPAFAAWPHEPGNGNVPVCTAPGDQFAPVPVTDGAGGAIVAWGDIRSGTSYDLYAQRISASGVPLWNANGVAISTATGDQSIPMLISDGAGGAIIVWQDTRGGANYDVYAQRVSAAGVPQWTANGVAVSTASGDQSSPILVSDAAGGAIIAWLDSRAGNLDVYAQRVSAGGATQWTANGVALCIAANNQAASTIASDGAGGAIVTWADARGTTNDIYAQRVSAAGTPLWTPNGVTVCNAVGQQSWPTIATDGLGGGIITWQDARTAAGSDIYAQRITATGAPAWIANGVVLCDSLSEQQTPQIAVDGAGGAIVTWNDFRAGNSDIFAQRVSSAGVGQWTRNGVSLCAAPYDQYSPGILADGAGGAIVTWYDVRTGIDSDIYAQRVSAAGMPLWSSDGVAVCTAAGAQVFPLLVTDGNGGAVVAWQDHRSGSTWDVYAQRLERYGKLGNPEPTITRVRDVPGDQGGYVTVSWDASYLDAAFGVAEYRVFRSVPASLANAAARRALTADSDVAAREGAWLAGSFAGATIYWEYVGTQAAQAFAGYSMVVATPADSSFISNELTRFMVEARTGTMLSDARWASAPDSGYSVDNLAPAPPAAFAGVYTTGTMSLHWARNTEPDLAGYRLYRGTTATFTPDPTNLVASPPDTGYTDAAGPACVYKLAAVDTHGNESPMATVLPDGTAGVGEGLPGTLALAAPTPNPAHGAATLQYTLSRQGPVRLAVFDAAGRRVRVVREAILPAGSHRETVALSDERGRALPSGLYLVRLEAEGRVLTRRVVAIR